MAELNVSAVFRGDALEDSMSQEFMALAGDIFPLDTTEDRLDAATALLARRRERAPTFRGELGKSERLTGRDFCSDGLFAYDLWIDVDVSELG